MRSTAANATTYTNKDRALLAGASAAALSHGNVKKLSIEYGVSSAEYGAI